MAEEKKTPEQEQALALSWDALPTLEQAQPVPDYRGLVEHRLLWQG